MDTWIGQFVVTKNNTGLFKVISQKRGFLFGFNLLNGKLVRVNEKSVVLLENSRFLEMFRFRDEVMVEIAEVLFKTGLEKANFVGVHERTFYRMVKRMEV